MVSVGRVSSVLGKCDYLCKFNLAIEDYLVGEGWRKFKLNLYTDEIFDSTFCNL